MESEYRRGNNKIAVTFAFATEAVHASHPKAWEDEYIGEKLRSFLLSAGTDLVLEETWLSPIGQIISASIPGLVMLLDNPNAFGGGGAGKTESETMVKIWGGGNRDLIRFYSKRVSCSCLKDTYAEAKKLPKTAFCT